MHKLLNLDGRRWLSYKRSCAILDSCRPINLAAFFWSEAWLIADITKVVQFFDALVVGCHRGNS